MKTKSFFEKFKGKYPTFSVWEVDDSGNKVGDFPLFSMGTRKATALANHLEDFKDFVELVKNSEVKLEV
jgi:muconolactone delta-isomerase